MVRPNEEGAGPVAATGSSGRSQTRAWSAARLGRICGADQGGAESGHRGGDPGSAYLWYPWKMVPNRYGRTIRLKLNGTKVHMVPLVYPRMDHGRMFVTSVTGVLPPGRNRRCVRSPPASRRQALDPDLDAHRS